MSYNAELQMLREFFLLVAQRQTCCFCQRVIYVPDRELTFGHRRHNKVRFDNFTVHHYDENRSNNADSNLKVCHSDCHRRFHKQLLLKGGPRREEEGKEGQEKEG